MPKLEPKLAKWIRWLDVIGAEVQALVIAKDIFWSVQKLIRANPKIQKPSAFYQYMGDTYVAYAVMGIRRHAKPQKGSITLAQLLGEIAQEPAKISRAYYRGLYTDPEKTHFADTHFDRFCEKPGDSHVSKIQVEQDLNALRTSAKSCQDFGDKRIAHRDNRKLQTWPTFKEANKAIETLQELCLKYRLILLADYQSTLLPTYQYDWQQIFDHPWRTV
ncbi:MAG: hypothetical protein O2960_24535 [Verrucomicrobia bacterium]|nr:hypothetical protein [Verrucomicrobiota bacterium]